MKGFKSVSHAQIAAYLEQLHRANAIVSLHSFLQLQPGEIADLSQADLVNANLSGADLSGAVLFEANLEGANLEGTNFSNATLIRSNLNHAKLTTATFTKAFLCGASFYGTYIYDKTIGFETANLEFANFYGATLSENVLMKANFRKACLVGLKVDSGNNITDITIQNTHSIMTPEQLINAIEDPVQSLHNRYLYANTLSILAKNEADPASKNRYETIARDRINRIRTLPATAQPEICKRDRRCERDQKWRRIAANSVFYKWQPLGEGSPFPQEISSLLASYIKPYDLPNAILVSDSNITTASGAEHRYRSRKSCCAIL